MHLAKLIAAVNKQARSPEEKQTQVYLVESMALDKFWMGIETKNCQIIHANDSYNQ